ncbi:RING zinc finger-containing protein [Heterostelium album PN500]|uniref:Vacuolar protein sorting-associated protein 11 homolog n=1 Tax=Heterostelium pallidum (strain ATCC 26659 / Pp 5 / PN500) TaxID=670386 RepID=D3BRB4_HETP5|nr:RING zinc finger-containing protein [Heterostelium album PN500]EFA75946.1 RING zinc finger-containing protein [Heterostelium album PN500]|eukprot:XP_020428080.1 RING zinc finger-containing protein [Heterostelium album PN500]
MIQWKKFPFFDKELVKEEGSQNPNSVIQKLPISCTTSGRGILIIGDTEGFINFFDREFRLSSSFHAYNEMVNQLYQLKERNFLISIGHDEPGANPILKIWNLDKMDKNDVPLCVRAIKIEKMVTITSLVCLEDLSQIAVGLANGEVIAMKGDVFRDKVIKQKTMKHPGESPVTGMGFITKGVPSPVLFVVTTTHVYSYIREQEYCIDEEGGDIGNFVMSDDQTPIIARPDAIYFYNTDGRGPCFGFGGTKNKLLWFRSYLVVVGHEASISSSAGGGSGGTASGNSGIGYLSPSNMASKQTIVNIYDLKNKYLGFTDKFEGVSHIASEWGSIFIFTTDGKLYQLEEKDTQTKLETLFKKNLYSVAIDLAKSQHYDNASIADIYRKYGDHLYTKGDFDNAISQYLCTIGKLEPSYVIRKFLDAQRIHNLTSYLQALHEKNLANEDHTTLLLNCYTKLKDVKKLDQFIKTDSEMNFDVETAIKVCRQAGYYEHALYLSLKHNQHDWYLKILLEDIKDDQKALDYIQTLSFEEADKNMKKYGKMLVSNIPEATTRALMKLCTDYQPVHSAGMFGHHSSAFGHQDNAAANNMIHKVEELKLTTDKAAPEEFIHIFVSQPEWLTKFLEYTIQQGNETPLIYNTLLELYLREDKKGSASNITTTTSSSNSEESSNRLEKAYEFLTSPKSKFDEDHALILAQVHNWKKGILYLYEKLKLYNEIIEYHMENEDFDGLIKSCKKYGDQDPNLWVQVLSYFATHQKNCQNEITEVLTNIDRDNLIPPLLVIQILAQNKYTTLQVIKDYISRRLSQETQQIDKDYQQIKQFAEETDKMRNEINELKTNAKIFQQTKCIACHSPLDLPSIHFLCQHSFHQRCLGDNERECPLCAPANKRLLEIKKAQADSAGQHDQFFKLLESSQDGFSTVSEYFGRVKNTVTNHSQKINTLLSIL